MSKRPCLPVMQASQQQSRRRHPSDCRSRRHFPNKEGHLEHDRPSSMKLLTRPLREIREPISFCLPPSMLESCRRDPSSLQRSSHEPTPWQSGKVKTGGLRYSSKDICEGESFLATRRTRSSLASATRPACGMQVECSLLCLLHAGRPPCQRLGM